MDGGRLLRTGRRGVGVALYLLEGLEYMELAAGNGMVKDLWVRIKEQTKKADVLLESTVGHPLRMMTLTVL